MAEGSTHFECAASGKQRFGSAAIPTQDETVGLAVRKAVLRMHLAIMTFADMYYTML